MSTAPGMNTDEAIAAVQELIMQLTQGHPAGSDSDEEEAFLPGTFAEPQQPDPPQGVNAAATGSGSLPPGQLANGPSQQE